MRLPGFNTLLCAAALGTTLVLGVCGTRGASAASTLEAHAREEIAGYGFREVSGDTASAGSATPTPAIFASGRAFRLGLPNGEVTGARVDDARAKSAAALVHAELARYPAPFFEAAHFHRVLLASDLREGGAAIPSLPNCGGAMILDVDASPDFLRRLVHHEVFHFADLADDGTLKHDPSWEALNDRFFVYGDGGRASRDPSASRLTEQYPGFLDVYARSAVEEDKAETFAFVMTEPTRVAHIAEHDAIVRAKVRAIRTRVEALAPDAPVFLP